jgi:hypothetical protein
MVRVEIGIVVSSEEVETHAAPAGTITRSVLLIPR